jgi:hypothetical protein
MPNGGSDCCGTCWFNGKNKGRAGFNRDRDGDSNPDLCTIRDLSIADPFYTYCGNHPHRRPERDPIPIGPVFVGDASGTRKLWRSSPDTETIRQHLLDLLAQMKPEPRTEYPIGVYTDETVVLQLGEFREERAVEGLRRVAAFDPAAGDTGSFGRTRQGLVRLAHEALAKIPGG